MGRPKMAGATFNEEEVWSLLGRVREALGEFLPETVIDDEAESVEAEVDELVKAVQFLGNLPPRSDLASLNRKFRTT
jgi:cell division septum initiation protein DivIVA